MRYRRLYIGRCDGNPYSGYSLGSRRKDWDSGEGFEDSEIEYFCRKDFEAVTGVKLKPGEIRKVRITVELLD